MDEGHFSGRGEGDVGWDIFVGGGGELGCVERMSVSWIRRMKGREVWAGYIITFSFFSFFVRLSYLVSAFVNSYFWFLGLVSHLSRFLPLFAFVFAVCFRI